MAAEEVVDAFRARAVQALARPEEPGVPVPPRILAGLERAGLLPFIVSVSGRSAEPGSARGRMLVNVLPALEADAHFAHGVFYGCHLDVGDRLHDFRSYKGTIEPKASLQIVLDEDGPFYCDFDRWNPYQDVVNFLGHAFGEVLPDWFRKVFHG